VDIGAKALLVVLRDRAQAHQLQEPASLRWLHIAHRFSPELARRMKVAQRAQKELDDLVLSLVER